MKIPSRRDNFFRVIIFGAIFICVAPMCFVYMRDGITFQFLVSGSIIMALAGLMIWVWHHTYYMLTEENLKYFSGPFRGKIAIDNIKTITINKTSYVGLKFGLARNGLIIETSANMDLYISPTNPQDFVRQLKAKKPDIQIKS